MTGTWIPIAQYDGFSIYKEESGEPTKIKTPEGEFDLVKGKRFHFLNPNTRSPNFAFPEVLLARAEKGNGPSTSKKKKEKKIPKQSQTTKAEEILEKSGKKMKTELVIVGYVIPDLSSEQAADVLLSAMPIFTSEKNQYKKALVFKTITEAKEAILERYGRAQ